ncbi:hypothetical protein GCM10007036_06260 [Alsobacter metallidurans]|uniref:DUF5666 domain-containing protein n=1 Tax=Alsobacter metallidurans TaxID=340221 RepID=A0A917I4V3_9HYPH|nr:hypothetical protein [Alsobacter metallidurans]GGH09955.1 hypothetical protein GCM10007036_06260 [Alsobacter metallidurans]
MRFSFFLNLTLATVGLAAVTATGASAQTARLRGAIVSANASVLEVRTREGATVNVQLAPNVTVGRRVRAEASQIKPNDYVGVAAVPGTGETLKAVEIFIFPAAMRGTGEGHRAWDLLPESTMTNATMAETVDTSDGKAMKLTYKGGEKTIALTPDTKVFTFAQGSAENLVPGRQVTLNAEQKGDQVTTARVTVDDP